MLVHVDILIDDGFPITGHRPFYGDMAAWEDFVENGGDWATGLVETDPTFTGKALADWCEDHGVPFERDDTDEGTTIVVAPTDPEHRMAVKLRWL